MFKIGDRVIVNSGWTGTVTKVAGRRISVKLDTGLTFRFLEDELELWNQK